MQLLTEQVDLVFLEKRFFFCAFIDWTGGTWLLLEKISFLKKCLNFGALSIFLILQSYIVSFLPITYAFNWHFSIIFKQFYTNLVWHRVLFCYHLSAVELPFPWTVSTTKIPSFTQSTERSRDAKFAAEIFRFCFSLQVKKTWKVQIFNH